MRPGFLLMPKRTFLCPQNRSKTSKIVSMIAISNELYVGDSRSHCEYMSSLWTLNEITEIINVNDLANNIPSSDILVLKIILVLVFIQFWVNNFYFSFS